MTTSASETEPAVVDSRDSSAAAAVFQIDLPAAPGFTSRLTDQVYTHASELGLPGQFEVNASRGFLLSGEINLEVAQRIAAGLLAEAIVQVPVVRQLAGDSADESGNFEVLLHVLPRPGVTDPEAESALAAIRQLGHDVSMVRTFRRFEFRDISPADLKVLQQRALLNDSIEQLVVGPLTATSLGLGSHWDFRQVTVPLGNAGDDELLRISREGTLSLTLVEMQTIQAHYRTLGRDPSEIELETIAQTWSEHCSHKTLAGRVTYTDENGTRQFDNMLKETIFAATMKIREQLGDDDWCVSVFKDNAGIIRFDDQFNLTFKVETHNRPSAIEPYGGANTGLGGVIRDTLGTGMGARPVCSTDVFCFANPETPQDELPPGVMHPRRIMKGVVAGVRDYGNRMGIPTVNGAIWFDQRYVGNPMVFCGNVGLIPREHSFKHPQPNDLIVAVGGRTGRDGIHGATFSSVELNETSETTSSGAVQIGNAIVEKMVTDVLLQARDRGLYNAVTDCGAGGFSSAVGEMGEKIGAEVWLDRVPLKYDGLSCTEIWISEAQERMVLAVPENKWEEFLTLCESESVEATVIGQFRPGGDLVLKYERNEVGRLSMHFLHDGRPPVIREAVYRLPTVTPVDHQVLEKTDFRQTLLKVLAHPNVASKHWVIRQYDHEVQGGSVVKPLVGVMEDGPSDAAVVRPVLSSQRGITVSNGMNPLFGDLDPGRMASASIDEAIRNAVATGADPERIGILDNFCWGYTDRPETLGSLVRAAIACQDSAVAMGTPFISGKDSLNNEFSYTADNGERTTVTIPSTLLISALGQIPDVTNAVTMDWKEAGNRLYLVGQTGEHLGGSHALLVEGKHGQGVVPDVCHATAKSLFRSLHRAMGAGLVRSCHDLSEGGLAGSLAEMALAGGLGANVSLDSMPMDGESKAGGFVRLFSESASRFVCEVAAENASAFEQCFGGLPVVQIGSVSAEPELKIEFDGKTVLSAGVTEMKSAWQQTLNWK